MMRLGKALGPIILHVKIVEFVSSLVVDEHRLKTL